jgi:AraC-like DNA-binding protein
VPSHRARVQDVSGHWREEIRENCFHGGVSGDSTAGGGVSDERFVLSRGVLPGYVASTVGYGPTGEAQRIHRGLPSPYLTFIFSLAGPVVTGVSEDEALGPQPDRTDIVLGGLAHRPSYVVPDPEQCGIQLAVHPLAARALFGLPARELLEVTDGTDVLGVGAERLRLQLADTGGWTDRFALVQRYLCDRIDQRPTGRVRPEIVEAWRWLAWHRGNGSMAGLARHVALSPRQLGTLFSRELGASPKQISRLMRFDHAKQRLSHAVVAGGRPDLAEIAVTCGYYDHAHLDRDFAQFVGVSPTAWLAEERRNIQAHGHRNGEDWLHGNHDPGPIDPGPIDPGPIHPGGIHPGGIEPGSPAPGVGLPAGT